MNHVDGETVYFDRLYGASGNDVHIAGNGHNTNPVKTYENALEIVWILEGLGRDAQVVETNPPAPLDNLLR